MTVSFVPGARKPAPPLESAEQRETRIQREARQVNQAHADINAGLGIDDDDVEAWLDQLDIGQNTAIPITKSAARRR